MTACSAVQRPRAAGRRGQRRRGGRSHPVDQGADPHPHRRRADHRRVRQHPFEPLRRGAPLPHAGHRSTRPYRFGDQSGRRDRAGVRPRQGRDLCPPGRRLAKPVNLFISSAHATYTLLLRRSDTPADTIVIRDRTPLQAKQAPAGRRPGPGPSPNHIRAMKALLVAMASDRVPPDIRVEESTGRSSLWAEARFSLMRATRGAACRREVPAAERQHPMVLAEQEFDRPTGRRQVAGVASRTTTCARARAPASS
jgi:hypothetical protein